MTNLIMEYLNHIQRFLLVEACWHQCDQIGQFFEFIGNKYKYKRSPNDW